MNYKRKPQIVVSKEKGRVTEPAQSIVRKAKNFRPSLPVEENLHQQSGFVGDDEVTETMSIGEETVHGGIHEISSYLSRGPV